MIWAEIRSKVRGSTQSSCFTKGRNFVNGQSASCAKWINRAKVVQIEENRASFCSEGLYIRSIYNLDVDKQSVHNKSLVVRKSNDIQKKAINRTINIYPFSENQDKLIKTQKTSLKNYLRTKGRLKGLANQVSLKERIKKRESLIARNKLNLAYIIKCTNLKIIRTNSYNNIKTHKRLALIADKFNTYSKRTRLDFFIPNCNHIN